MNRAPAFAGRFVHSAILKVVKTDQSAINDLFAI
jgi:hypothetical protein